MKLFYTVHRVSDHQQTGIVEVDGEEMPGMISSVEVELIPADARQGTITLRFIGKAAAEAKATFSEGASVPISFGA